MFAYRHATLITPDIVIEDGSLVIDGDHIQAVGGPDLALPTDIEFRDATGLILAPGFIDLQVNGGFGLDFTADPTTIWNVAAGLPRYGVTSFLPTVITSPPATVRQAQDPVRVGGSLRAVRDNQQGSFLLAGQVG